MYEHYAVVQGAELRQVTTSGDRDFKIAADQILDACDDSTKLIFLCSPNNPTGTLLPTSVLIEILERRADRSAVVVDEAYIEFAREDSAVQLVQKYENLIVLRTLSKALAYAGASLRGLSSQLRTSSAYSMQCKRPMPLATPGRRMCRECPAGDKP